MSFVLVRNRSRLGHKPDYRLGWSSEYVRKSMYACRSVSVACRPAEMRRRRGEIGSIHRSILVGHRRPNRRQRVNGFLTLAGRSEMPSTEHLPSNIVCKQWFLVGYSGFHQTTQWYPSPGWTLTVWDLGTPLKVLAKWRTQFLWGGE